MVCHLQNGVTDNDLLVLLGLITDQILIKGLVINTLSGQVITHMTAAREKSSTRNYYKNNPDVLICFI